MAAADTAFAMMDRRVLDVFGETVTRLNGAPAFVAEMVEQTDDLIGLRGVGTVIRYRQADAELLEGETIVVKGYSYLVAEPAMLTLDGMASTRLHRQ